MHLCDRCHSQHHVHPTRVSLVLVRVDLDNSLVELIADKNNTGTVDLCDDCRQLVIDALRSVLRSPDAPSKPAEPTNLEVHSDQPARRRRRG